MQLKIEAHNVLFFLTQENGQYKLERQGADKRWEVVQSSGELNPILKTLTNTFELSVLDSIDKASK